MPVVWADSGYNVPDTYRVAEQLIKLLKPNLKLYIPEITAEHRNAIMGGIPHPDDNPDLHKEFTRQVKLEPFNRAFADLAPKIWVTGIRKEETAFRQNLDILSWDGRGILWPSTSCHLLNIILTRPRWRKIASVVYTLLPKPLGRRPSAGNTFAILSFSVSCCF